MKSSGITYYHTKYLAAKIKRKSSMESFNKLLPIIYDSDLPLYPHQLAAADFVNNSTTVQGTILSDEMGLGKTIEAGLAISLMWNEGYKQILIIAPVADLKMWKAILITKFGLDVEIYNKYKLREFRKNKVNRPFAREVIKICSYKFAFENYSSINPVKWDLVTLDQAHRVENVYDIKSEVGDVIRQIAYGRRCLLITSNPLQSTMKRLFKLGNLVDKYAFGDRRSYNYQFVSITDDIDYPNLRKRLEPIAKRTLGRRVSGFVNKSRRIEIQDIYEGTPQEADFITATINYYINTSKFGIPNEIASMPALGLFIQMTISPKLALGGIGLVDEGLKLIRRTRSPHKFLYKNFKSDIETLDWINEEWHRSKEKEQLEVVKSPDLQKIIDKERNDLLLLREYALEIQTDSRFKALLSDIERIKKRITRRKMPKKIVIFTQSKLAQRYLVFLLRDAGFKGVYYVNADNDNHEAQSMYEDYMKNRYIPYDKSILRDYYKRLSIIETFQKKGTILVATDKGIQDQVINKCSAIINYDLPFDPYLTDLRLKKVNGFVNNRDVYILNIVNKSNEMELWNYTKQRDIFNLFNGSYGQSDTPVGAIGVGADYSMLVFGYYMMHHTIDLVDRSFKKVEIEIRDAKSQSMNNYYTTLLEKSFKDERIEGEKYLEMYQSEVIGLKEAITKIAMKELEKFGSVSKRGRGSITIKKKPFRMENEDLGKYTFDEIGLENRRKFYLNRGIGKQIIESAYKRKLPCKHILFSYNSIRPRLSDLLQLKGKSGILLLKLVTIQGIQNEQYLLFCGKTVDSEILTQKQCHELMLLKAKELVPVRVRSNTVDLYERNLNLLFEKIRERDERIIEEVSKKIDLSIEDKVLVHKRDLRMIMIQKRKLHRRWVNAISERRKDNLDMALLEVGVFRRKKRRYIRKVRKYGLIEKDITLQKMKDMLNYQTKSENLFTIKWELGR